MIVAFGNLKGGVGKSKLTAYFGNYLSSKGFKVLIVDGDVNQHTTNIYDSILSENDNSFKVVNYNFAFGNIDMFVLSMAEAYDYVFVDIPGTIQQEGLLDLYVMMDKIIIPTSNQDEDLDSTCKFINFITELRDSEGSKFEGDYKVLLNNYEVQYFNFGDQEKNQFPEAKALFGTDKVFDLGIRKERSLLQSNFVLGQYGSHPKTKRVEETLDLIFNFLNEE